MRKVKLGAMALAIVLFLTGMAGAFAVAEQGIAYDACIDYNDPNIRIIYEGDPVMEEGITTFAACDHSNSYLTGHTVIGYEPDSSTRHVVVYTAKRYCNTCKKIVSNNVLYETTEKHQGAPCQHCGFDPY